MAQTKKKQLKQPTERRSLEQIKKDSTPVGIFVREQRKYLGYTQDEFAHRVGVNLRFLKELELGKKSLRMDKVNQVLNYLGAELMPVKCTENEE